MRQLGSNMDPTHHEKIVDKLMQYRGKIPKDGTLSSKESKQRAEQMRGWIDALIIDIDWFAECFEKGLIR